MISDEDKALLSEVGVHQLTVNFMEHTTTLTVTVEALEMNASVEATMNTVYNGKNVQPTVTGAPASAKVVYTYYTGTEATEANKVNEAVNAGTYTVVVTVSAKNYTTKTFNVALTIDKANVDTSELVWDGISYTYSQTEKTLSLSVEGLPEGFEIDAVSGDTKATEIGEYTAKVTFKGTNPNYNLPAEVSVKWQIVTVGEYPLIGNWYASKDNGFTSVSFNDAKFIYGGAEYDYEAGVYNEESKTVVVAVDSDKFTSVKLTNGVLTVVTAAGTETYIPEAFYNRFIGDWSIGIQTFSVSENAVKTAFAGGAEETLMPVLTVKEGESPQSAVINVGKDWTLALDSSGAPIVKNYANAGNYDIVGDYTLYSKESVDALFDKFSAGTYSTKDGAVLTISEDKKFKWNGTPVYVYVKNGTEKLYYAQDSNNREKQIQPGDENYVMVSVSYSMAFAVKQVYAKYAGTYFLAGESSLDSTSKVAFLSSDFYFQVEYTLAGSKVGTYNYEKGSLTLSQTNGAVTMKGINEDGSELTFSFGPDGVAVGENKFVKTQTLLQSSSYSVYPYYNSKGEKLSYNYSKGILTFKGVDCNNFTVNIEDGKTTITLKLNAGEGTETHTIEFTDNNFLLVDGNDLFYYHDMASNPTGYTNDTYYAGENTFQLNADGRFILNGNALEDVKLSLVEVNEGARTVLKAEGSIGYTKYTVIFYSLTTVFVNDTVYYHNTFKEIVGTEYLPSADSTDSFLFDTDGKLYFRGEEIFLNSARSYTSFFSKKDGRPYRYSFDINGMNLTFNDSVVYNVVYLPSAYYEFGGAYISEDGDKGFYFAPKTIYYHNGSQPTTTTNFTIKFDGNMATMTLNGKEATFIRIGSATVLSYEGVSYSSVADFDFADYNGRHIGYDGGTGIDFTFNAANTNTDKPYVYGLAAVDGELCPIIYVNYNKYYMLPNTDAATKDSLPYLVMQEKFLSILGSEKFNGKQFSVIPSAVKAADGSQYITTLAVTYGDETCVLTRVDASTYSLKLGGKTYYLRQNEDKKTQKELPLLVFDSWFADYEGSYTLNGNTTVFAVAVGEVDVNGTSEKQAVLKVTFNGKEVEAAYTDAAGGKYVDFEVAGVDYRGILSSLNTVLKAQIYTLEQYNWLFLTENSTYTIGGKTLVLPVSSKPEKEFPLHDTYVTTFDKENAAFDGKAIVDLYYIYSDRIVVFTVKDGEKITSYALELCGTTLYTDVLPDNAEYLGSTEEGEYGTILDDTFIQGKLISFDKTTEKAVLGFYFVDQWRRTNTNLAQAAELADGGYKLIGQNANGTDIAVCFFKEEVSGKLLWMSEDEYFAVGTFTVDGKTLTVARTFSKDGTASYTASYDGAAAVAIAPDFAGNSFRIDGESVMMFSWTVKDGTAAYTMIVVPKEVFDFVGEGLVNQSLYSSAYPEKCKSLEISLKSVTADKVTYTVNYYPWGTNSSKYSAEGTLSEDKTYISTDVYYGNYIIYLNGIKDSYVKYLMYKTSDAEVSFAGEHTDADGKALSVKFSAKSTVVDDGEGEDKISAVKVTLVVTYDGKECTAASIESKKLTFTCEGKTYEASFVNDVLTITEKA